VSVQAIAWVLDNSQLTGTARCVLLSIANHVGPDGYGWVHVSRVCHEARCSVDSYRRAVQLAESLGELERTSHAGGGVRLHDRHRPNLFTLPALTTTPPAPVEPVTEATSGSSEPTVEDTIFAAWLETTGRDRDRTKFTDQRRKKVRARLAEGYTPDDLLAAVRGVMLSPFHMGDNERKQRYDDLTTVLRDGAQVERFRELDGGVPAPALAPRQRKERGCDACEGGFIDYPDGSVEVCQKC
jgi:hypothetical protein